MDNALDKRLKSLHMNPAELEELRNRARALRRHIIRMIHASGTAGHYGGSLSCVEILTCLFFHHLRHKPADPGWPDRDRFVLSKGHAAPVLYAALAEAGYFPAEHLGTFKRYGSILQGHPDMLLTPGVEMSTGSLGQGLSAALGMALAGRLDGKSYRVYVLLGDGELDEGSVWEAAMAAAHHRVDNLTAILDRNSLQVSGPTEARMRLEPLADKWRAFGWEVLAVDGHDIAGILEALGRAVQIRGKPCLILARTVKGKGLPELEGQTSGHSCTLTEKQVREAMQRLEA
jgi:transketolase